MSADGIEWLATAVKDGIMHFRVGRRGDDVVAEWVGYGTLVASRDGERSELTFADDVSEPQREKLRRGGARVLLAQLRGELALHGSAVEIGGKALVLVGPSGAGKSTLAAALCARGGSLLADDAVSLRITSETALIEPTEALHWLDSASCAALSLRAPVGDEGKVALTAERVGDSMLRVAAVVELTWMEGAYTLRPAGPVESLARILPHVGRILLDSADQHRRELDQLTHLLGVAPLYILARPRDFRHLATTVDGLLRLASRDGERDT